MIDKAIEGFRHNEEYLSQIPALQQLINLGFTYLTPEGALNERQRRVGNVLLENILEKKLKELNKIEYKGNDYLFSEANIQSAIQRLKNVKFDGIQRTNEVIYDLLTLGTALEQSVEGNLKSYDLKYIDWENWDNNDFHVTAEFSVERTRSAETARPDIVLFVNGIPLCVIECKSPKVDVEEAIGQSIRNQSDSYIPKLFVFTQLVLGINKNDARYATAGTPQRFWSVWKEKDSQEQNIEKSINTPLEILTKETLFSGDFAKARNFFDKLESEGDRLVTEQDRVIFNLCRPERLIELAYKYTLFEAGIKKIARYQQYFVVKSTLNRIKGFEPSGARKGGVIWHTQGSGKSLTMVMLGRSLALDPDISNPRIVLVTDRDDLDKQLGNTFAACGLDRNRAKSGRHLLDLISSQKAIVTTLIHKFEKALDVKNFQDNSTEIFILVDESHRTNFGTLAARMRQMFPKACYLGFTGTPLMKQEKNNFTKFGELIDPHYSIRQAVEDKAVVPLLYEGRHTELNQNKQAIDLWFDRHTQGLSDQQKADLKRKYARGEMLQKSDQVIYMQAFDISEHYRQFFKGTGLKGQLVARDKATALKYHEYLNDIGSISSEVIISPPDMRTQFDDVEDEEPTEEVKKFWNKMLKRYGSEEEYTKQVINQFKYGDDPEILIVVDKLLTGFDAPRNTVLYLCRKLKEHTLLQAIARVNRLYDNKDFGRIIDYASILGELDKALVMYDGLSGFDQEDIEGALRSVNEEIEQLPQRYSDLWDVFKEVKNQHDEEAYEQLLADEAIREDFYERLSKYGKTLQIALSTEQFIMNVPEEKLKKYRDDLKRFHNLKDSVKMRYAEKIDYRDYEPKIKKLLDTHIQANKVTQLNEPIDIFDEQRFEEMKEGTGIAEGKKLAARADTIAHATKKVITEKMDEDPAFYKKFSDLIQQIIDDFRAQRISDLDYLNKVTDIRDGVVNKRHDNIPLEIAENEDAVAYFGNLKPFYSCEGIENHIIEQAITDTALKITEVIKKNWKVNFWDDVDSQNKAKNDIDDFLYDEIKEHRGINLTIEQMDSIIEKSMQIARHRHRG